MTGDVTGDITSSGNSQFTNRLQLKSTDGTPARLDFYCESSNAHYLRLQAPPHSQFSGNPTVVLPNSAGTLLLSDGSGASLTNLPAGQLTGALPAIDGSALTGIAGTANVRTGILDVAGIATFRDTAQFDGSIGVGIANPSQKIHIDGGNLIISNSTAPQIRLNSSSSDGSSTRFMLGLATGSNQFINGSSSNEICISSPSNMLFGVGSTRKFRIKTTDVLTDVDLIPSVDNQTSLGRSNVRWSDLFAVDATFSGNVSIAGTLTYEDVTNIDSVGLITARSGLVVGTGVTLSKDGDGFFTGVTTSTTFVGNLTGNVTGTASNATQLNSQAASYYLDYDNFSNTPTIPTNNNQLTNGAGFIDGSALNASNLSSGTIPDARFPSTLPAIDGSALTGIANTSVIFTDKVSLGDNERISVGLSSDLSIYHDGSQSIIQDTGTGQLAIRGGITVSISNPAGTQVMANFINGGAVNLFHAGVNRFKTTSTGAVVTGILTATSNVKVGSGITLSSDGDIFATGVTTSTTFVGDLTGDVTGDVTGTASNATLAVSAQGLTGSPNITVTDVNAVDAIISGNLSVAGTITSLDQNDILATGIITASSGVDLGDPGIVTLSSDTLTTTSSSADTVASVSATVNRSATFQVQVTRGTEYHVTTINVVHDGTNAFLSEYGTIRTGSILATFDADISGGNLRLRATPTSTASTVFKLSKTTIKV